MSTGTLFIISAASGTGKTTLVNALVQSVPNLMISTSYTTREKRETEEHDRSYHFVTIEEFDRMVANHEFVEHAIVYGNHYGTSKKDLAQHLDVGKDVILEIDWQGAQQVRQCFPDVVSIFILPPSRQVLRDRIVSRNQDLEPVIERRLKAASSEIAHCSEYDYLVVNDALSEAVEALTSIVRARRSGYAIQCKKLQPLLRELMA